ncbi:MAG: hypothetical protein ACRD40_17890 [Candidatus Acidiferrales bacterium]
MAQLNQQSPSYRVEVSGWDAAEAFFSENTVLYSSVGGHELALRSRLREGVVIFVRLLQPFGADENFPVPHVVTRNLPVAFDDRTTMAITKLHPRLSYRQSAAKFDDDRANCA